MKDKGKRYNMNSIPSRPQKKCGAVLLEHLVGIVEEMLKVLWYFGVFWQVKLARRLQSGTGH